jgi:hypothetical protein
MSRRHRARGGGEDRRRATHLVLGVGLMAIGALMLLRRLDMLDLGAYGDYWPLLLVAVGLVQIIVPDDEGRRGGLWLFSVGVLLQLHVLRILRFHESWPLFIVVMGAQIVLEALARSSSREPHEETHDA